MQAAAREAALEQIMDLLGGSADSGESVIGPGASCVATAHSQLHDVSTPPISSLRNERLERAYLQNKGQLAMQARMYAVPLCKIPAALQQQVDEGRQGQSVSAQLSTEPLVEVGPLRVAEAVKTDAFAGAQLCDLSVMGLLDSPEQRRQRIALIATGEKGTVVCSHLRIVPGDMAATTVVRILLHVTL
jgi:hypothetical protein